MSSLEGALHVESLVAETVSQSGGNFRRIGRGSRLPYRDLLERRIGQCKCFAKAKKRSPAQLFVKVRRLELWALGRWGMCSYHESGFVQSSP